VFIYAPKALQLNRKLGKKDKEITNSFHLGIAFAFREKYDTALSILDKAYDLTVEIKSNQDEAGALSLLAFVYVQQGKFQTASDYYLKTLAVLDRMGPNRGISTLTNLAELYRRLHNTQAAIQYLDRAMDYHKKQNASVLLFMQIYNEYAFNYLEMGDLDKALEYAQKADGIKPGTGIINECDTKRVLARIYLQKGDYEQALEYAKQAMQQADRLKDKSLTLDTRLIFSDIYMAQENYTEAESEAEKIWLADSANLDRGRMAAYNIAMANIHLHHTEKAALFLKKYSELNTQFTEKSFQTTVSDLNVKYEIDKKETRIAALERQKILYIVIGIAGFLLAIVVFLVSWQKVRRERLKKELIATNAVLEWEKVERRRFASDLHDGINGMLSAINMDLGSSEYEQEAVRKKIDECIETIRRMARSMMPVSLERYGLKSALEDYCRLFPNVHFQFFGENKRMDEKIELQLYYCAYELVNNSFKHSGAKDINVQLIQSDNRVSLSVQDNGCGFDKTSVKEGYGLQSIHNRVASCKGKLDIVSSQGAGTEVNIELKIQS
jgi:signal transduction histidine kinase/Tfp pilus assembly protein PilF